MVSQLHHLLLELIPGGAKKDLSAAQAKALLAKVRPRDAAGKTRRRVAAELISDLERVHARKKAADKELKELVAATGSSLLDLSGIGPTGAARLLVEVADITRFTDRGHFASWNGTAPIDASSATTSPPALSRREPTDQPHPAHHGGRPATQPRPRPGLLRRQDRWREVVDGSDALLKRRLSDIVYRRMLDDAINPKVTGPGGQPATSLSQRDRLSA
jgi:transposase